MASGAAFCQNAAPLAIASGCSVLRGPDAGVLLLRVLLPLGVGEPARMGPGHGARPDPRGQLPGKLLPGLGKPGPGHRRFFLPGASPSFLVSLSNFGRAYPWKKLAFSPHRDIMRLWKRPALPGILCIGGANHGLSDFRFLHHVRRLRERLPRRRHLCR